MLSKLSITIKRTKSELLEELFSIRELPVGIAEVSFELNKVNLSIANAIRRTLIDEMTGNCLSVEDPSRFNPQTTEKLYLPQLVNNRIHQIPICPNIDPSLKFSLKYENMNPFTTKVYSKDLVPNMKLKGPIFNPTFELAEVQPGKKLIIDNIKITKGKGKLDSGYQVAVRCVSIPLDIPQYADEDVLHPESKYCDESGYEISTFMVIPMKHRISFILPAVRDDHDVMYILKQCIQILIDRISIVRNIIVKKSTEKSVEDMISTSESIYSIINTSSSQYEGTLIIVGETDTIGNMISEITSLDNPEIKYCGYKISHSKNLEIRIRHNTDVTIILLKTIDKALGIYRNILSEIF